MVYIYIHVKKIYYKTIVFKCNCYVRKQTVQNVPKYRGQHHESNNLEERIQFMIVKINILALMSPKRRLIILRECEIKTVHRLYCEARLPYLKFIER